MTHKERTLAAMNHQEPDRVPICVWYTPEAEKNLLEYLGLDTSRTETYKSAGGPLPLKMGHDFLITWIGPCTSYYAQERTEYTDGSLGLYESGWGYNFRSHSKREFIGSKGRIRLIHANHRFEHREEGDLIEYYSYPDHYEMINVPGALKPVDMEFQNLIEYIEKDKDPLPALDDALKSLEIMLAGHKSSQSGKTVYL